MGGYPSPDPISQFSGWLGDVLSRLRTFFNSAWKWIKNLWDWLYNHILSDIINAALRLWKRVKPVIDNIVKWIKKIRAHEIAMFDQWVKPILNFIQRLRASLLIFRIFGFKWASKLDARLANIEQQLTQLYLSVLQDFNRVLSYLNLIIDPSGLFKQATYLATAIRSIGSLVNAIQGAQSSPLAGTQLDQQQHNSQLCTFAMTNANAQLTAAGGLSPDYSDAADAIRTQLVEWGWPKYN